MGFLPDLAPIVFQAVELFEHHLGGFHSGADGVLHAVVEDDQAAFWRRPMLDQLPHLGADGKKNWVDIATADVAEEGK